MHREHLGVYFLLALLIGVIVVSFFIFQPFLGALVLASVFAVVLEPLHRRVMHLMPRWPSLASLVTVILSLVCLLVPLGFIGTQIGIEAASLSQNLVNGDAKASILHVSRDLEASIVAYFPQARGFSDNLSANISTYAQAALQWLIQHLGSAFAGIASLLLSLFVFFVALYYLLRDGEKLRDRIVELSPLRDTYDESVFDKLKLAVNSVVRGNLTIALIQGVLTGIGFTIFGVPNSVLWGSVAAIAALIPGLGTGLVFVPTILYLVFTDNVTGAMGLIIWGVIAVGLIDNLLAPKLIGSGMQLHPLLVLLSVLGGITLFGPLGIFLGPLTLSLLFALLMIYSDIAQRPHS